MNFSTAQDAFSKLAGGTFVGLDTLTPVTLKGGRANPQQGRVTKRVTGSRVMCFSNQNGSAYEAMVKRRLVAEGQDPDTFEVGPRAWGERIVGTPFVEHRGAHYIEVIVLQPGKVEYLLDGTVVDRSEINGLDRPSVNPDGQGGLTLENRVIIRTFALDSIVALRTNGQEWV